MDELENFTMVTPQLDAMVKADVLHIIEEMPWMKGKKFILMHQRQEIEAYIDKLIKQGIAALDLETTGLSSRMYNGEPVNYGCIELVKLNDKIMESEHVELFKLLKR